MNEQMHTNPEHHEFLLRSTEVKLLPDALPSAEVKLLPDAAHAEALRAGERDPLQARAKAREKVSAETDHQFALGNPLEQIRAQEVAAQAPVSQQINRELKTITLTRELNAIRRKLPAPQRALSKVIHRPAVRAVSEVAGSTVSRPSGLLGGGILAFLGSTSYLYLARHIGFEYNFGVFLVLFAGGFAVGLGLELIVHVLTASRRKAIDA